MKYLGLIWTGLWRKKARTIFSFISIAVAFLLFGTLQGIDTSFTQLVDNGRLNILVTTIVSSVLSEALLLALLGALLGGLCAWAFFDGHTMSMISGAQSQLAFPITVTPGLILLGVLWAQVIGLIGGLLPAIRAARIPVASALKAVT